MELDPRILMFVVFGAGLTLAVTLERWLARFWLSLPILYVTAGYVIWSLQLKTVPLWSVKPQVGTVQPREMFPSIGTSPASQWQHWQEWRC